MATWTIIENGRDAQGRVQCTLFYDGAEIGTDTLGPLMEVIEGDGRDDDVVIERRGDTETARYTVARARANECEWQAGLRQNDAAA